MTKATIHLNKIAMILILLALGGCVVKGTTRPVVLVPPMPQSTNGSPFDFHFSVQTPIDRETPSFTSHNWAVVEFEVSENGSTNNIRLIDSSHYERFGETSIEYVSGLQLYPHFDNWKINENRKKKAILEFSLLDYQESSPQISTRVFKEFEKAHIAAEQEDYNAAENILNQIEKDIGFQEDYAKVQLYNFRAFIAFSRDDYEKAKEYYRLVVFHPITPFNLKINTLYSLSQLEFVTKDYKSSLNYLLSWDAIAGKSEFSSEVFKAQILYFLKQKGAAKWILDRALLNPRVENKQRLENALKFQKTLTRQEKRALSKEK